MRRPPPIDGVGASRVQLLPDPRSTLLDALCARFPAIDRDAWRSRFARGRVLGPDLAPLQGDAVLTAGLEVFYYREVAVETRLPVEERLVHVDDDLVVVDKPHFLPVVPAGDRVADTLLARLVRRLDAPDLVPLHRIDRLTAGLVMFSMRPASRDRYLALFRERRIRKRYEALAPPLPALAFPHVHRSRLERGEPFFTMREAPGAANSETRIEVLARGARWRYALEPLTGRKHQLRVHMAALGAPIDGDPLYPALRSGVEGVPLSLLARALEFVDPLSGRARRFESGRTL